MIAEQWLVAPLWHTELLGLIACDRCGVVHDSSTSWVGTVVRQPPAAAAPAALLCVGCAGDEATGKWLQELARRRRAVRGAA